MLKLILGRNQEQLTNEVMLAALRARETRNLLLVPENYSHMSERLLCWIGGNSASARCEVVSFPRLAQHVFQVYGGSAVPVLDNGGCLLLMHLAVKRLESQLKIYGRAGDKPSFLVSLLDTMEECKSYCISPEALMEAGNSVSPEDGRRLQELGLLFGAYDALTKERAEDPRDRLTRLAEKLRQCDYLEGKSVYICGFTDFTPQELQIIETMLENKCDVLVGLRCDSLDANGDSLFAATRQTAHSLIRLAKEYGHSMEYNVSGYHEKLEPEMEWLEKNLFAGMIDGYPYKAEHVSIRVCENPFKEVDAVAQEILHLVRDGYYRYRDIVVTSRTMEGIAERIETVFSRYNIPTYISEMDDILQKPIMTLITAALDAIAGGYEYDDVFRYLKTDLTGVSREERDKLENYVLKWNIRGNAWIQDKPWRWPPQGYGVPWTDKHREEVRDIDDIRRKVVGPMERLRKCGADNGAELTQKLYAFLQDINLPECLNRRTEELYEMGDLQEAEEYCQVWEILVGAMEQCSDLLKDEKLSLTQFSHLFQLVLGQYKVGTIPVALDRVTCSDMARISHGTCKVLFILGADDDNLPQVNPDAGLLTREDREILSGLGHSTPPTQDESMDREMLMIYECCSMPSERLYISYAIQSMEGIEKRPSFVVHRINEVFAHGLYDWQTNDIPPAIIPAIEEASIRGDVKALAELGEMQGGEVGIKAISATKLSRADLNAEAVDSLYRGKVRLSASRMDKVQSCHFSYFLQYGLKAKARKRIELDAPESGTFVHYILECVLGKAREMGGVANVDDDALERMCKAATAEYIEKNLGGMDDKTPRFRYLFRRLAASAVEVVRYLIEELKSSDFNPIAFELGFGSGDENSLPPVQLDVNGIRVLITGFVDRVDGWVHDGRLYLRVMDYKTGHKSFKLEDIWHGLNMQMLLYLFTLQEKGLPGDCREIVPAGVLYIPAREETISGNRNMEEAERVSKLEKELRRSGLVLNETAVLDAMEHIPDGEKARFLPITVKKNGAISSDSLVSAEQMGKLRAHIDRMIRKIAIEIGRGNISADPCYRSSQDSACRYCEYASVCHFEDGRRGERSHYLYTVKGDQFWERVDREEAEGGEEFWV